MFKNHFGHEAVQNFWVKNTSKFFKQSHYGRVLLCSLLAIIVAWLPPSVFGIAGLTVIEQRVIALFVFAASMWLSDALPAWGTSFLVIVLMIMTVSDQPLWIFNVGAVDGEYGRPIPYKQIMATLADPTIMLFIGGFVLAIGMTKTKFDLYMAKVMLKPFGNKSNNVLLGFIVVTAVFSAFVSNTATAAMMLAFLVPVLKVMDGDPKGKIALAMAIPIGANIGGMATPIGTPPNIIAVGYLNEALGMSLGFGAWMWRMIPFVAILLLIGWIVLRILFPFKQKEINLKIDGKLDKSPKTFVVIITFIVTVFLWCFSDVLHLGLNSYSIALIPVASFILTGIFTNRDLEEINWGVLWMVAGGFALGLALNYTRLSQHLIQAIPFGSWPFLTVTIVAIIICYILSNFISNSATASLLVPVLGVIAGAMQAHTGDSAIPMQMLVAIAIASSSAMLLPISTPPNAIAQSTGLIKQSDMIKVGAIMGLFGLFGGLGWMLLVF